MPVLLDISNNEEYGYKSEKFVLRSENPGVDPVVSEGFELKDGEYPIGIFIDTWPGTPTTGNLNFQTTWYDSGKDADRKNKWANINQESGSLPVITVTNKGYYALANPLYRILPPEGRLVCPDLNNTEITLRIVFRRRYKQKEARIG